MIFQSTPNLIGNERKYLNECIDTTFVSSVGPFVDKFENDVGRICGSDLPAVSVSSGTCGLHLALHALGVKHTDLVIIPSFTFIATANAVSQCGATPWLHDVTIDSWTLDPNQVRTSLEKYSVKTDKGLIHKTTGQRITAIMPVYAMGHPAEMSAFKDLSNEFEIPIIADAAAAIGAKYQNLKLASLADFTVFSFNGNKTITCGGGGAIVSNYKELLNLARHKSKTARVGRDYLHDMEAFNYRMTNLNAAVGCAQLENLNYFLQRKKDISDRYQNELANITGVLPFPKKEWAESACWFSGVLLDPKYYKETNIIFSSIAEKGIEVKPFWRPIHLQPPYSHCIKENLENSESLWKQVLVLPCSTHLTNEQQTYVIKTVEKVLQSVQQ